MAKNIIHGTAPGEAEWKSFLKLPRLVYAPYPETLLEDSQQVSRELARRSPFKSYCKFQSFVSIRVGKPHARVTAILNRRISGHGDVGMLGYFEALPSAPEQTGELLQTALSWLQKQGAIRVMGPMNFNTWHKYRLTDQDTSRAPFLLEPFTPGYYPALFEAVGFKVSKTYYSARFDLTKAAVSSKDPLADLPPGITHRSLDPKRFETEVHSIYDISVASFGTNPEFMPVDWSEFWDIYRPAKRITDPEFVHFLTDSKGRDIAFAFAYQDLQALLCKMQRQPLWLRPITYLLARKKKSRTLIYKSLAILPEYQGARLGSILSAVIHDQARKRGLTEVIHALMEEENRSRRIAGGGHTFRTYRLYELVF